VNGERMSKLSIKGKPLKYKAGRTTSAGRPVYVQGEDFGAELVSEKSVTIKLNDKYMNVPSIHNGEMFTLPQLKTLLKNKEIKPTSTHDTVQEAVTAAKKRSKKMTMTKDYAKGGGVRKPKLK